MAKIYGLFGSMTGKLADTVMVVRNGVQIARKYQPVVTNPRTQAQTENRAKLKLMSQLSAVMGPYIAIPRQGMVSTRNLFTKKNFGALSFSEGEATVNLGQIKLTTGVISMPKFSAARTENGIDVHIVTSEAPPEGAFSRVVYVGFVRTEDGTLRILDSKVVTSAGEHNQWRALMALTEKEVYFYAYAVRDNSDAAREVFSDMTVASATQIASLIVTRQLTEKDVSLTDTAFRHLEEASQNP